MTNKLLISGIFVLLLISCGSYSEEDDTKKKYLSIYSKAINSSDEEVMEKAINLFDTLIKQNNTEIQSIHYNKAQLLYKLDHYHEAVAEMIISEGKQNAFYTGTLLLKKDEWEQVGKELLQKFLSHQKDKLIQANSEQEKEKMLITIRMIYRILGKNEKNMYRELKEDDLPIDEMVWERARGKRIGNREEILNNLWPD